MKVKTNKEIFEDTELFLDTIKKAGKVTERKHGNHVTLERAIFLSWWCDKGDCKFCFISTQKGRIVEPKKARRRVASILTEAELCNRVGWNIEFLSGGYGSYTVEEIKEITEMVAYVTERPVWLNIGTLTRKNLEEFGEVVEGITGAIETVNERLHDSICPSKPIKPIVKMLKEAKELGFKTGITIILGLGEEIEDLAALFKLIADQKLDRITFYSLNPHEGTIYEDTPPPSSLYQAGAIALTRINFPDIRIIGGTWVDQLSNIGLMLMAGANGITKYPLLSMFGNRYGKKVEEEVRFANKRLLGTFTDLDILKGIKRLEEERRPQSVFNYKRPAISEGVKRKVAKIRGEINKLIESYVAEVEKNQ